MTTNQLNLHDSVASVSEMFSFSVQSKAVNGQGSTQLPSSVISTEGESSNVENTLCEETATVNPDFMMTILKELTHLENYTSATLQKKWSNNHQAEINKFTSNLKTLFASSLIHINNKETEISRLQGQLLQKQETVINMQKELAKVSEVSYASKVKKMPGKGQSDILTITSKRDDNIRKSSTSDHLLILETEIEGRGRLSNEEFQGKKRDIIKVLQPGKLGIGIKSTGTTKKGGIVMSFETEKERMTAKDIIDKNKENLSLRAKVPTKLIPKMSLLDVGNNNGTIREIQEGLISQNSLIKEKVSEGETFEVLFISKKGNAIIKVSPSIRNIIKAKGRLFLELQSFKCVDHIYIKQCYKCNGYGHTEKSLINGTYHDTCPKKDPICAHCSGPHRFKECDQQNDPSKMKCINCHESNFSSTCNHRSTDHNCQSLEKQRIKVINSTDFGKDGF